MAENNEIRPVEDKKVLNFVQQIVADDLAAGKNGGRLNTRFPPEPNGYLHIGHAKAICMDFGVAEMFGGTCNLRFDDTNPQKEDTEYVESIKRDIHWLGYDWGDRLYYASDYFEKLYDFAIELIKKGLAYVDDQTSEQIAQQKGTPTQAGTESPYRNRSVEENLDLFERMNAGEFDEGARVLRAKIDMASSNMHFRDPIIYRIIKTPHWRTGTKWKVYPMYDFAHGQSDYFEGVTHSICTLEFVPHRPLYEYFAKLLAGDTVSQYCPRQIEPTICGLRRRGYTPQSIKNFLDDIGYTKYEALNDIDLLEHNIRDDLNKNANRVCAVLDPVKVVITNYPEDKVEMLAMDNNPEQENAGTHEMPFSREIYIERDDFMENPPKKFFRMTPGKEVRLKGGYILSGTPGSMRKVKGTLHWVSARHCKDAEVRLYDRLFAVENPSAETDKDFRELLNPDSLKVITNAKVEPYLAQIAKPEDKFQFQRIGYFCVDLDSTAEHLVFNRTIGLKDSWAKAQKK